MLAAPARVEEAARDGPQPPRRRRCVIAATGIRTDDTTGPPTTSATTRPGRKRLHHPVVGDLELDYEVMDVAADSGPAPGRLRRRARYSLGRGTRPLGKLGCDR